MNGCVDIINCCWRDRRLKTPGVLGDVSFDEPQGFRANGRDCFRAWQPKAPEPAKGSASEPLPCDRMLKCPSQLRVRFQIGLAGDAEHFELVLHPASDVFLVKGRVQHVVGAFGGETVSLKCGTTVWTHFVPPAPYHQYRRLAFMSRSLIEFSEDCGKKEDPLNNVIIKEASCARCRRSKNEFSDTGPPAAFIKCDTCAATWWCGKQCQASDCAKHVANECRELCRWVTNGGCLCRSGSHFARPSNNADAFVSLGRASRLRPCAQSPDCSSHPLAAAAGEAVAELVAKDVAAVAAASKPGWGLLAGPAAADASFSKSLTKDTSEDSECLLLLNFLRFQYKCMSSLHKNPDGCLAARGPPPCCNIAWLSLRTTPPSKHYSLRACP